MNIPRQKRKQFQSTLIQQGWVTQKQLKTILKQKKEEESLEELLVVQGILSPKELEEIVSGIRKKVQKCLGKYEILGKIAKGAMGVIYKVRHVELKQIYALKVIIAGEDATQEAIARFDREAKLIAKLKHPNIVQIIDSGQEGQRHYFCMEYIEGTTLEELIEQKISVIEGLQLIHQALEALHYAHEQGILHRDLKPSNIFITKENQVKIGDFGLARDVGEDTMSQQLTYAGEILGTPNYMSPEQAAGKRDKIDIRSDIYSIGACLYRLFTGHCPFEGKSFLELFYKIVSENPQTPSKYNTEIDRNLDTIILKSLKKPRSYRYQTAQEFADDIDRFLNGYPIHARPASPVEHITKWTRRNTPFVILTAGMILFGIVLISYSSIYHYLKRQQQLKTTLQKAIHETKLAAKLQSQAQRTEQQKHLLKALNHYNIALAMAPKQPQIEEKKYQVAQELIYLACQARQYKLASYVSRELQGLTIIPQFEKSKLLLEVQQEKTKVLNQHLKQFQYWVQILKSDDREEGIRENAIFEISKMNEEEIFEQLIRFLEEGKDYFFKSKIREPKLDEFYETIVTALGRLENPKAGKHLWGALEKMIKKMSPIPQEQRPVADIQYMIALTVALDHIKMPLISEKLHHFRLRMGTQGLYWEGTQLTYKNLAKRDGATQTNAPSNQFDYYHLGNMKFSQGLYQEAINNYNNALRINSKDTSSLINRGVAKLKLDNIEGSIIDLTDAIRLNPNDATAYRNRGVAKQSKKDYAAALQDYNTAIRLNPKNAMSFYIRGQLKQEQGLLQEALRDLNVALQLNMNDPDIFVARGSIFDELGQLEEAIENFDQALALDPKQAYAYLNRGISKQKQNDFDGALYDFTHAIHSNPQHGEAYFRRASIKSERKDYRGAIEDLNETLQLDPKDALAFYSRGAAKYALSDLQGAIEDCTQAIKIHPSLAEAYIIRGTAKLEQNEFEEALLDFEKALQLAPENHAIYYTKSLVYQQQGKLDLAIETLKKGIQIKKTPELANTFSDFLFQRGLNRARQQEFKKAHQDFLQYQQWAPPDHPKQKNLQKILKEIQARLKD